MTNDMFRNLSPYREMYADILMREENIVQQLSVVQLNYILSNGELSRVQANDLRLVLNLMEVGGELAATCLYEACLYWNVQRTYTVRKNLMVYYESIGELDYYILRVGFA